MYFLDKNRIKYFKTLADTPVADRKKTLEMFYIELFLQTPDGISWKGENMPTNYDPGVDYSALIAQEAAKGVNANRPLLAAYETFCAEVGGYAQDRFEAAFGVFQTPPQGSE